MKALSVREPYAWLICAGLPLFESKDNGDGTFTPVFRGKFILKDIENRSWFTSFRGRIYIHAAKRDDGSALEWLLDKGLALMTISPLFSKHIPRGAIIGEVDIVTCIQDSKSPWAIPGMWHWVLANPTLFEKPIPYRGRPGLFDVELPN